MAATIKDIAKKTGLSIATVSKHINGIRIRADNGIRIQGAIDELGYKVNEIARGLKTSRTMTIGVLIPSLVNIFSTSIVSAVERIFQQNGYSTFICDYSSDPALEESRFHFLLDKSVDGIIITPTAISSQSIAEAMRLEVPVVAIDQPLSGMDADTVLVDNMNASYQAVEHLIQARHRKIGIIHGPLSTHTAYERLKGYLRVHVDYRIPALPVYRKCGDYEMAGGYAQTKILMSESEPPTALFVTNYEMTLGAVIALNEMNVRIPDDLSFIGFDNLQMAMLVKPRLTIVVQPMAKIGEQAAALLLKRLKGDREDHPYIARLKTELIPGDSVRQI